MPAPHTCLGVVSGRTGVKTGKIVVMERPEGVVRGGMVGSSPSQGCHTHRGCDIDSEGVGGMITDSPSEGHDEYTPWSPAQLYSSKSNQLVHRSWQCNDIRIQKSHTTF